jgi:hypothetical protein
LIILPCSWFAHFFGGKEFVRCYLWKWIPWTMGSLEVHPQIYREKIQCLLDFHPIKCELIHFDPYPYSSGFRPVAATVSPFSKGWRGSDNGAGAGNFRLLSWTQNSSFWQQAGASSGGWCEWFWKWYPLVICYRNLYGKSTWKEWIFPWTMVLFHSYVSLPEGILCNFPYHIHPNVAMYCSNCMLVTNMQVQYWTKHI